MSEGTRTPQSSASRRGSAPAWLRRIYELPASEAVVVFCPERGAAVELAECRSCGACRGLFVDTVDQSSFLRCAWEGAAAAEGAIHAAGDSYGAPPLGELPVSAVMNPRLRLASGEWTLTQLAAWFLQHDLAAAPVTDQRGELIGVVSKSDLLRHYAQEPGLTVQGSGEAPPAEPLTADIMTPLVFGVSVSSVVGQAAALMAYEGVHHLLVRDDNGHPVGMVSSLDITRRLALDQGYALPKLREVGDGL